MLVETKGTDRIIEQMDRTFDGRGVTGTFEQASNCAFPQHLM